MSGCNQEMLQIGGDEDRTIGGSTPDSNMSFDELVTTFESETVEIVKSEMVTSFSETKKLTKFTRDLTIDVTSTVVMNTEILEAVNARLADDADVPPLIHIRENEEIVEAVNEVVTSRFQLDEPVTDDCDLNSSCTSTLDTSQDFPSYTSEEKHQENEEFVKQFGQFDAVIQNNRTEVEEFSAHFTDSVDREFSLELNGAVVDVSASIAKSQVLNAADTIVIVEELRSGTSVAPQVDMGVPLSLPSVEAQVETDVKTTEEAPEVCPVITAENVTESEQQSFKIISSEVVEVHPVETARSQVDDEPKSLESMSSDETLIKPALQTEDVEKQKLSKRKSKDVTSVRTFESVSKSLSSFASSSDELKFITNSSSDEIMEIPPPDYETEDSVLNKSVQKPTKEKASNGVLSASMNDVEGKKKKRRTSFRDIFMKPLRYKKQTKTSIPEFSRDFTDAPAATSTLTKLKKEQEAQSDKLKVPSEKVKVPSTKGNSLKRITSVNRDDDKETQLCASWFDRGRQRKARRANGASSSEEEQAEKESTMIICTCREGKNKGKCPSCSSNYIEIPVNFREISPDDVEKLQSLKRNVSTPSRKSSERPRSLESKQRQRNYDVGLPPVTYKVPSLGDIVVSYCKKNPQVFTLNNLSSVKRREDLGPYGVEDMINIDDLNEASLLWNLRIRYDKELIYTYIGSILIAVNPYRMSDVYGLEMVKKYEGQVLGTMPPHLFAIGSAAYARLTGPEPENQVVIISGESGAGKTESTKLVMQYLAAVNKSHSNLITEQILEAAPLLESFGNAKTVRNDNSSRFGKYLQVYFKGGVITGAKVTEYLLEKSRIVTHAAEERNYHVFYELLKGLKPEEKEKYGLYSADKYFYLNQGGSTSIPTKDDHEDFQSLLSAMQVLGFTLEEQDTIFRILAAVLHFGNVYFHRKPLKHGQEGVEVGSDVEVKWAAHLLQLSVDGIMRAVTTKTTEARNERMFTPLNIDQALDARDAIAKALYSSLFSWLVNRVNTIVSKGPKPLSISILDIFGFEDFKENSFEQLCINYANESLQAHFNRHIFRIEQQEYIKEKIEWQTINFTDNQPVINLICKKPVGILHLLDDESNFPKATDQSFLEKAHYNHALNEYYCRPRLNSAEFGVKHYAGLVWYSVDGFLDKNRDTLRMDVLDLLISSKITMISRMFQELKRNNEASKSANRSDGRFITMKPRTPTVAARFHDSLTTLLESMSKCNPWFVRCLKPNSDKIPMKFDMPVVLEQLRYTGMLETIRIRKTGYPIRMRYAQFAERFRCLVPVRIPKGAPSKEICRVVLDRDPRNRDHYQLGSSKVFMREPLQQRLEKERMVLQEAAAVRIQTAVRGYLARRRYRLMKKSAVTIQSRVRGYIARKRYRRLRRGIVKAQAKLRGTRQRKLYLEMKEELKKRAEAERERVRVHKQKMEEESKAIASSNQLEIPADLAFIVNKLDDWHPVHTERNIVKLVGQPPQREDYFELPPDISEYSFQKFAKANFKSHVLGATQEPIVSPLLPKTKEVDYQDSIAIFKLILRFSSDSSLSPKREYAIGSYIVNKGLLNDKLRDEILCQLVNQTWQNPDESNAMRVWLLMSSCLSAFAPSPSLYKFLLKYVSDQGPNGYDVICQQKLLQAARNAAPSGLTRSYPPSVLEWRCNKKKVNMALEAKFSDENSSVAGLESWGTCEEVASLLVSSRGINEDAGWTLNLSNGAELYDLHGTEFMLDVLSELETPPAFPVMKSHFLRSVRDDRGSKKTSVSEDDKERKISVSSDQVKRDLRLNGEAEGFQQRSLSLGNLMEGKEPAPPLKANQFGLSHSKLNERYLSAEKLNPTRPTELNWNSRNRKYSHDVGSSSESEPGAHEWDSRRPSVESSKSKSRPGLTTTLDASHRNSQEIGGDSDFDVESSPVAAIKEYRTRHGHPRFVKSQQAFRKSKGERDYLRSSAHSDTSEAPSLASHVRRVRVPSHASDVDQFLDDLFLPVLDVNIDDLSDARSLATSIKGGRKRNDDQKSSTLDEILSSVPLAPELSALGEPLSLAKDIKGGGRGEGQSRRKREPEPPMVPQPAHGYASPAPLLLPNMPVPMYTPTGTTPDFDRDQKGPGSPRFHTPAQGEGVFRFPMAATPYGYMTPDFLSQTPHQQMQYLSPFLTPDSRVNTPGTPMSPVTPFPVMPGYAFPPAVLSGMMSPGATGFDINNLSAIQQNMQRLFLQSAVAQNMQIQQQLIAQNQALQQLLQQSAAAAYGSTPEPAFPLQEQWPAERRSGSVREVVERVGSDRRPREHIPPPVLPKSKNGSVLNTSAESASSSGRLIPRVQDERKQSHESFTRHTEHASPPLLRKIDGSSDTKPFMSPAKADESKSLSSVSKGDASLESRPLAVSSRRASQTDVEHAQPAKTGVPPPPPLPTEPLFSGDQPFMDQYGRAKTVRIGKWRWPPPKGEGDEEPTANFLEFKLQKQAQKKLMAQRSREENIPEIVEFDSFDIGAQDEGVKVRKSVREVKETLRAEPLQDEKTDTTKPKPPGSIGKLKLSGELRSKLEMVHSKKSSRSSLVSDEGSQKEESGAVTKLAEHRKLLLEKQLYGGRWQSVEEIETITRVTTENGDEPDRARPRRTSVTHTQEHRTRSTSSPPSSYYSPSSTPNLEARKLSDAHMSRKFSSQSQLVERTEIIEREFTTEYEPPEVEIEDEKGEGAVDGTKTKLHNPLQASFFTYNNVPWTMHVRKEVFSPSESLVSPLAVHLVFAQIVQDTDNSACLRMLRNDRAKMKQTLDSFGISPGNVHQSSHKMSVKRNIIELAKEFPLYFCRMYPVSGGRQSSDVQFLAVSHSGLRLVKRETTPEDRLIILDTIRFDDVIETSVPRASCLQIRLKSGGKLSLYSHRATLIRDMIERFAAEADTSSQTFVKALADYVTKEPGLLAFKKGDLIRVANPADNYLGKGWLYGMLNGKAGVFPTEYVEFLDVESVNNYELEREMSHWRDGESPLAESPQDSSSSPMSADDGKHSLLQFALQHFRQNPNERVGSTDDLDKKKKNSKKPKEPGADWTWKQQVDMVKFSKVPISASLLRLESNELNKLAVECFLAIMRYMGDLPMGKNQSEVDCVYTLLMNCHKHAPLRDEVYCQLMKQTTSNRSARQDSCQRGWRLLCIVAAYFDCSQTLQPYLLKYLESAAYDKRRAYHGTALVCLQNLRKTIRYGGRKNVPSIEEITALTAGRNAKRQIYQLPGGTERIINTKSTTVVQDIIEEICLELNVRSAEEMEEFSLYCIVEGDTFTMPLAREEYILDVTTELHKNEQVFYLIFCRSVWHHPLRLDSPLYVEVAFNQIAPDYLEGLLLVMPGEALSQDTVYDIAKIAALLHRAPGLEHVPNMKETKFLLPKPALAVRDIKPPQWVSLVQSSWKEVDLLKPVQAKAQVLEILQRWPLFGSSFFAVKRVAEPGERAEHILALNRRGVHFLDVITHETLIHYPFSEVISTRKVKSEDGALFLDMKCGNLMQQRITRIQTDQAHEISRLIRQYINIEQRQQSEKPKK